MDQFKLLIEWIANDFGTNLRSGINIHFITLNLKKAMLDFPKYHEETANKKESRISEKEVYLHVNRKLQLENNIRKMLFLLVLQSMESLKAKLHALSMLQYIKYGNNAIVFICTIK